MNIRSLKTTIPVFAQQKYNRVGRSVITEYQPKEFIKVYGDDIVFNVKHAPYFCQTIEPYSTTRRRLWQLQAKMLSKNLSQSERT